MSDFSAILTVIIFQIGVLLGYQLGIRKNSGKKINPNYCPSCDALVKRFRWGRGEMKCNVCGAIETATGEVFTSPFITYREYLKGGVRHE
jgi:hypothetical protein